jgi:hypothetical protein
MTFDYFWFQYTELWQHHCTLASEGVCHPRCSPQKCPLAVRTHICPQESTALSLIGYRSGIIHVDCCVSSFTGYCSLSTSLSSYVPEVSFSLFLNDIPTGQLYQSSLPLLQCMDTWSVIVYNATAELTCTHPCGTVCFHFSCLDNLE